MQHATIRVYRAQTWSLATWPTTSRWSCKVPASIHRQRFTLHTLQWRNQGRGCTESRSRGNLREKPVKIWNNTLIIGITIYVIPSLLTRNTLACLDLAYLGRISEVSHRILAQFCNKINISTISRRGYVTTTGNNELITGCQNETVSNFNINVKISGGDHARISLEVLEMFCVALLNLHSGARWPISAKHRVLYVSPVFKVYLLRNVRTALFSCCSKNEWSSRFDDIVTSR